MNLIPSPWTVQLKCLFSVTNYFCLIPIKAALQFHWLLSQVCVTWPFLSREGLLTWEGGASSRERVGSPHMRGWGLHVRGWGLLMWEGGSSHVRGWGLLTWEGGVSSRERVGVGNKINHLHIHIYHITSPCRHVIGRAGEYLRVEIHVTV